MEEEKIISALASFRSKGVQDLEDEDRALFDAIMKIADERDYYKELVDTILGWNVFEGECPINFGYEDGTKEDKAQEIFFSSEYCEEKCFEKNEDYKGCWIKYFDELRRINNDGRK